MLIIIIIFITCTKMSEKNCNCKKQKTELDNIIHIIKNYKNDDNIFILLKTYENLQNYIKDKNKDINEIIINNCLEAVINTIDNINNKKVDSRKIIIIGCNILRMISEHENINKLENISKFINCVYNVTRKNNTNNEILKNTIKTLLNFDIIKDHDNIIINRIQIIIDVMKKNIIINSENKTIVLNLCTIIEKNYINKRIKEYTYICLETLLLILKTNPNEEEIQESLLNIIIKIISFNTTFDHNMIIVNNGINIFVTNIKKYENNLNIVTYSCKLLIFLLTISSDNLKYGGDKIENFDDIITEIIKLDCIEFFSDSNKISNITLMQPILLLIRKLCSSEKNYIKIIKAGYINKILQIIEKYKKNVNTVLLCLCFLKYIYLYDIRILKKQHNIILELSDLEIIISVIKLHTNNVKIQLESFQILYRYNNLNISLNNENLNNNFLEVSLLNDIKIRNYRFEKIYNRRQIFVDVGGIDVIFEAIEKNKDNIQFITDCYNILSHYIYYNGKIAIDEVINKKGIEIVSESLKTHIKNTNKNIRRYTLLLLSLFCINPDTPYLTNSNKEYQITILKSGCIQQAMESLQIETTNNECMELNAAISLLAAITIDNKDSVINIIESGGFNVILRAIKSINKKNGILLAHRAFLAHRACYLISNILIADISDHGTMKFAMENGIELVVQMMKEFCKDRGLCNPLKVLYYVSKNEELLMSIATIIGMVGGFKFLLEFIHIRSEDKYNENVNEYASEILNNLTKDNSILKKMKNDNILDKILEIKGSITDKKQYKYSELINKLNI
jgi:hypothetical protein